MICLSIVTAAMAVMSIALLAGLIGIFRSAKNAEQYISATFCLGVWLFVVAVMLQPLLGAWGVSL